MRRSWPAGGCAPETNKRIISIIKLIIPSSKLIVNIPTYIHSGEIRAAAHLEEINLRSSESNKKLSVTSEVSSRFDRQEFPKAKEKFSVHCKH
jgi:hypothetical protein